MPNDIAFIPSVLPINKSSINPIVIPIDAPYILPINIPIHNENTMKRLGFTPAILNQIKKFDCRKYININIMNITIIDNTFFIVAPLNQFVTILHYFFQFFKKYLREIRILEDFLRF